MPIVHIQHYRLLSIRFRHSSIQTRGPVAINWPSPLPPASVKYDEDAGLFKLECATTLPGIVIDSGHITVVLEPDFKTALDFQPGTFPPLSSGELYFPRIDISIAASSQYEYCMVRAEFTLAQTGKDYAPSFAASLQSRVTSNVCFDFPRIGRQLWGNETILRKASPYFENLFSSGFSESSSLSAKDSQSSSSSDLPPYTFAESDDETDQHFAKKKSLDSKPEPSLPPFKKITIVDTAWSTYFSVLCWIGTRHILFGPLHSSSPSTKEPSSDDSLVPDSATPPPVSPKSVYRLAHFLELSDLADLALAHFASQLNPTNVALELFSDVASTYSQIRDLALTYMVDNWKDVKESKAYEEVRSKAKRGEGDVETAMLLAEGLAAR